jgi:hypothetical protein
MPAFVPPFIKGRLGGIYLKMAHPTKLSLLAEKSPC